MKTVQYHILVALAGGPLHGAEIRRRVEEQSGGSVTLYPAMLYGSLDDMVQANGAASLVPVLAAFLSTIHSRPKII